MRPWIHPKPYPGTSQNVLGLEADQGILQLGLDRQRDEPPSKIRVKE